MGIKLKLVLSFILIIIIGAFLVYKFIYNKAHPDYDHLKADFKIEAKELFYEFRDFPIKSSEKYNGKMIEITGNFNKIETLDSLMIAVFSYESGMFGDEGIRCTFLPQYYTQLINYAPDISIKVKGFCSGYNQTDVILEKCSIIN